MLTLFAVIAFDVVITDLKQVCLIDLHISTMAGSILQNLLAQASVTNVMVAVVAIILLHYVWTVVKARLTLPNGPMPWPIVGSTFTLAKLPEQELLNMRKRYGDVFTVFIGTRPCIVINGVDNIKEAFLKNSITFAGMCCSDLIAACLLFLLQI